MTLSEWAAWAQFGAGLGTFVAAALAVKAAYEAPKRAAEFAEQLRKTSAEEDERRRVKMDVLSKLLQHRATFEFPEGVNALNLIPIAFVDDREVRDAHAYFMATANAREAFNSGTLRERYMSLVEKIVRSVGLSDKLSVSDLNQGYYPNFLEKQRILVNKDVNDRFNAAFPPAEPPAPPSSNAP